MKTIAFAALSALAVASLAFGAHAQSTDAKVPTGYQVKGCTEYKLEGGTVIQVCDTTKPALIFDQVNISKQGGQG